MDSAIPSIFGTPTSNRLETPVDKLAEIVNSLSLGIPDTSQLEKFEQDFVTQLGMLHKSTSMIHWLILYVALSVTGADGDTNFESEIKKKAATEWVLRSRRDAVYQWRKAEFYIAERVNNGGSKERLDKNVTNGVQHFFGECYKSHLQAMLRQSSPYKVSEEVVEDYIRGVMGKYEAKGQDLVEAASRFKEQFGEETFERIIL